MTQNASAKPLRIGALSAHSGVHVETIRYYERVGLLSKPARTEGGQRSYASGHVHRLVFIRRSRELGFSLEEVRMLLRLHDAGGMCSTAAREIGTQHLANVRAKIASLKKLERNAQSDDESL
jgi:MerR family mercuric resistance operon transcriptional regulator